MSQFTRRDWLKTAVAAPVAMSAVPFRSFAEPTAGDIKAVVGKAIGFLETSQKEPGNFFPKAGEPGLTALIVASLLRNGVPGDNSVIKKAMKYLEGNIKKDGGVYDKGLGNYMTCLAIMAFKEMNTNGKYSTIIENATKYVKGLQDDSDPKDVKSGGVGYDGKSRPDLSNTNFMVEALLAAGVSKDDPAIKKALVYVSRCQNYKSEFNEEAYASKTREDDKGGFVYNPLDLDNDKSTKRTDVGGLRSEGGMTYGGLKSFLYAGVSKDDKRVKAAIDWVRKHYTVTENPGEGQAGLYYYYHTFAKAMDALGEEPFVDAKGVKHDWRQELFDELKKKQSENGSWANKNKQFLEDVPELATAFALLSLSYCRKKA
ncbi:MAG TPA: prenyltransferase/squalene oxidase repeat-containing protein [Gemmata sp.]|jgi:squalene-hopene/tetraprenyl-beta-curcumene cyclase|nr:prenyltransferase/squalene oxidase repeat-containing protein [Gemmata sp.]